MLQGSIILDMVVVSDTKYISLDSTGNNIQGVQLLPAGSAMSATLNAGVIPLANNPLLFAMKDYLNPQIGGVLAIELPFIFSMGATFSIQVLYTT